MRTLLLKKSQLICLVINIDYVYAIPIINTDSPERVESRPLFVSPSTSPRIATINLALIIVRYRYEIYGFTFLILTGIRLLAVNLHLFLNHDHKKCNLICNCM